MKKLTKLIFAGLLALTIAPAAVLSLTSMKEPVQVSAEGETRVYNIKDLKSALEGSQYSKIILDDELIIRDDVDPRPEVIFDAPEGYGQVPYITITSPKELVLAGNCIFEQSRGNGQTLINDFIFMNSSSANLTISGAGTLGFKFSGSPSIRNSVINVNGGTLNVDSQFVTIKGDVKTKTSCNAIYIHNMGNAHLNGGKITSVHSSNTHANDANNYTVYTTMNGYVQGNLSLSGNVDIDFEKTNIDTNSVAALAWAYPSENEYKQIEKSTINIARDDLGADFKGCLKNSEYKIYDADGTETSNINQKIIVKEPGRSIIKQPVGGSTKIGKGFKYDFTLDFVPEQVRLQRFKIENYSIEEMGNDSCWHGWGNQEDWDAKTINPASSNLTLEGNQYFRINFVYTDASSYQRTLKSTVFKVSYDPYLIRFDANGGSGTMNPVTFDGQTYTLPYCGFTAPANKAFDHWEVNGEAKKPLYDIHPNGDAVVKAIWRTLDWKFILEPVSQTVPVGQGVALEWDGNFATTAKAELLKQVGANWERVWIDTVEEAHSNIVPPQQSAVNITFRLDIYNGEILKKSSAPFTIRWKSGEIDQYTINFDAGEGTGTMDSLLVNENEEIILPYGTFEAPSYQVFVGWAIDDDTASTVDYEPGAKFSVDNVHTFYAVYENGAMVTFDANGGTGTMEDVEHIYGPFILPDCEFEAPEGQYFSSWDVDGDTFFPGDTIGVYADVTVTANWSDYRYNVFYNANGGSGTMNPELDHSVNFAVPECGFTAPDEHHQFSHWAIDSSDGEIVQPEANITLEGDITLFAVWELKQYTVVYNAGEASSISGNNNVVKSNLEATSSITLEGSILFKNPQGKHFKEWAINTANGEKISAGASYVLNGDTTFIAIWENDASAEGLDNPTTMYTISFNANSGTGSMESLQVDEGTQYVLPANGFTAPTGKMFDAWEVEGQRKLPNETITINADTVIKALWKDIPAETFTVSFSANGGTGTMNPISGIAGEYALPQCTFTAPEGKEFAGWKVNGQGNLLQAGEKINVTSNVDLVAQWKDKGGDTPVTPDEPVTPEEPSKSAGLPAGAIVGIVIGSVLVVGIGGFALVWFVIKKKTWADFLALFKKK